MDMTLFPTKGNLIRAKGTLSLSKQGYELLDKKRNILVREMMALIERAGVIQQRIHSLYKEAYEALQSANISIGIAEVEQLGFAVPEERSVKVKVRSIMGVEIPTVDIDPYDLKPRYGFSRTNLALDIAYQRFDQVKHMTVEYAEVENAVYRLAVNIRKTQKRANALKNIMIPRYEKITRDIQDFLDEKDREEFTRLKMIKKRKLE
ncbi:MAG: V-type ATP synthase subunit D [Ruminiclostridium sp.]|nr:V-type ATP synthase subunit D [Ruminiclostridium sp.]